MPSKSVQVGGASTRMEPAAARVCLQFLLDQGVKIKCFVTDRSSSLRTLLRLEFPQICHQFDVWHYVKVNKNWYRSVYAQNFMKLSALEYPKVSVEGCQDGGWCWHLPLAAKHCQHDLVVSSYSSRSVLISWLFFLDAPVSICFGCSSPFLSCIK